MVCGGPISKHASVQILPIARAIPAGNLAPGKITLGKIDVSVKVNGGEQRAARGGSEIEPITFSFFRRVSDSVSTWQQQHDLINSL